MVGKLLGQVCSPGQNCSFSIAQLDKSALRLATSVCNGLNSPIRASRASRGRSSTPLVTDEECWLQALISDWSPNLRDSQCATTLSAITWQVSRSGVSCCQCTSITVLLWVTVLTVLRSTCPFSIRYSTPGDPSLRSMRSLLDTIMTRFSNIAILSSLD